MRREHMLVRVLRALSGKTQEQVAVDLDVDASLIAQFEAGKVLPSRAHLEELSKGIGLTLGNAESILHLFHGLRDPRLRRGQSLRETVDGLREAAAALAKATYLQLLGVPIPGGPPSPEERQRAEELFQELEALSQEERLAVVQEVDECRTWSLLDRVCQEVDLEAPRNAENAEAWVQVAQEIAANLDGPDEWRRRIRKYVAEHAAKVPGCLPS